MDSLYSLEYLFLDFTSVKEILIKNLDVLKKLYLISKVRFIKHIIKLFIKDLNFDFMHNFCNQIDKLKI